MQSRPLYYAPYALMTVWSNSVWMFADYTTFTGQISINDGAEHKKELESLEIWWQDIYHSLSVSKMKEQVIGFRNRGRVHTPDILMVLRLKWSSVSTCK